MNAVEVLRSLYGSETWPRPFHVIQGVELLRGGADPAVLPRQLGTTAGRILDLAAKRDPIAELLGLALHQVSEEHRIAARRGLVQLLPGRAAEIAFEAATCANSARSCTPSGSPQTARKGDEPLLRDAWHNRAKSRLAERSYRNEIDLMVLRKTDPRDPESWIEIGAFLSTTAARYARDMRAFRRIVRSVRIVPDGKQH